MKNFMIIYFGGDHPSSPEEGQAHFQKYQQWLNSISENVITAMAPLKDNHTVNGNESITKGSASTVRFHQVKIISWVCFVVWLCLAFCHVLS